VRMDLPDGPATKQMHLLVGMAPNGPTISQYYIGMTNTHGEGRVTVQTQVDRSVEKGDPLVLRLEQRMDGFVSADSSYTGGKLLTTPFELNADELKINIDTSASGSARAALIDESGAEIAGCRLEESDMIQCNDVAHTLSWRGSRDLSRMRGKRVRLLLKSRSAKLYAVYP